MNYIDWETLTKKSIYSKWKATDRFAHLKFLNLLSNKYAKLFIHLYSTPLTKIIPGCVKIKNEKGIQDNFIYGHITASPFNYAIRLSTCLDIQNNMVSFPIEEYQYFLKGQYLFFTCGDMFLTVNCKDLYDKISNQLIRFNKSKVKNYEIFISDLFNANLICYFGYLNLNNYDVDYYDQNQHVQTNLIHLKVDPIYLQTTLRGAFIGANAKYRAYRIEHSDYIFEYKDFMNLKDLLKEFGTNGFKSTSGYSYHIKFHNQNALSEKPIINHKNVLKKAKDISYIIASTDVDIDIMQRYCQRYLKQQPKPRSYNLRWAVMRLHYCKSTEEYKYYKQLFTDLYGIRKTYTENEVQFFKDCYQHKPFNGKHVNLY